ncbi:uncharacterized protein LOC124678839 [Lolium rigidum]|uniref:uncharacterized protein LOC124678839 n=1 Tax=Lolium rigidum TaxID=89674 RepID=UPI001F5CECE8|nr:uncharacterized protein LOC124678839 [Lolium rigidum]
MSGSYSSRIHGGGPGGSLGATTLLAAKVAFASAALAAAASLARVAIPQLVSGAGADAFIWKLYLFVTVHVIIFVIWKLSDSKHFHAAAQQHKDPWAPVPHHPAPPLLTEDVARPAMERKVEFESADNAVRGGEEYRVPQLVSRRQEAVSPVEQGVVSPGSCGGESCVTTTTESDEDESYAAVTSSAYVAAASTTQSVAPARERVFVQRGLSLPPPPPMVATAEYFDDADPDHANGDDDLDATWNAIMQKTRPAMAPALSSSPNAPRSSPPRPRAREPSVGAAELSRRSDDFINKIHHSFGRDQ